MLLSLNRGNYHLSGSFVAEPRAQYRRNYDRDGAATITRQAEGLLEQQCPRLLERVLELLRQMRDALEAQPQTTRIWLDLEEALNSYWLEIAAAHYDLGANASNCSHMYAGTTGSPRDRVLVLMQALRELADDLPTEAGEPAGSRKPNRTSD